MSDRKISSSLTEMLSPTIIAERVTGKSANYDWVNLDTLAYFKPRLTQAPKDVDFALEYIAAHAHSRVEQEQVLGALRYKCDILWSMLNALHFAYVSLGWIPPGAFVPDAERAFRGSTGVSAAARYGSEFLGDVGAGAVVRAG